jgi:hypothetical protein
MIVPSEVAIKIYSKKSGEARARNEHIVHVDVYCMGFSVAGEQEEGGFGGIHANAPVTTVF